MKIKDLSQVVAQYRAYPSSFNGMREDNELKGEGNSLSTLYREYDPRVSRWLSLDPKLDEFPNLSPFASMGNNPIVLTDKLGDKPIATHFFQVGLFWTESYLGFPFSYVGNNPGDNSTKLINYNMNFDIAKAQTKLNKYVKKWKNKKNKFGSVGAFADKFNFYVTFASNLGDAEGFANSTQRIMVIKDNALNEERTAFHELIHLGGYNEFQTWAACYYAGYIPDNEMISTITHQLGNWDDRQEFTVSYILQGAPPELVDKYFSYTLDNGIIAYYFKDLTEENIKEFLKEFKEIGKKTVEEIEKKNEKNIAD